MLVVDDNDDNVKIMSTILLGRGFEVRIARNGQEALRSVEQQRPDLILLDVMMPGMNGMDVLDAIKGDPRNASVPIIMVTAKDQDQDVLDGYRFGAEYYITKPFTSRQLLYAIALVLGTDRQD